tara:strand:- start:3102 stop:3833 length:732 start_codon:yes stop_codon:yes gene_type:complete
MGCDKPVLYPPGAEIRHEMTLADGSLIVAPEVPAPCGAIQPPDGRWGGTLFFRSPNCWVTWYTRTVWNHVNIPTTVRTGPASWAAIRLTSGCDISYQVAATSRTVVAQDTGIDTLAPTTESDIRAAYWFEPDFKSNTPLEVFPIAGDVVPPADMEPIPPGANRVIGYCPRMTRFAMVSSPTRITAFAEYPGSLSRLGSELIQGPNLGDDSFHIGQWARLVLENLNDEPAPFKVLWSDQPGGSP